MEDVYASHDRWRSLPPAPLAMLVCDAVRARGKSGGGGARRRLVARERVLLPPLGCTGARRGARRGAGGGAGRSVETTSKKEDVRGELCGWRCAGTVADAGLCPRATPNSSTTGLSAGGDVSVRGGMGASRRFAGTVFACPLWAGETCRGLAGRSWARGRGGGSSGCHDVVNRSFLDGLVVRAGVSAAGTGRGRGSTSRGGRSRKSDIAGGWWAVVKIILTRGRARCAGPYAEQLFIASRYSQQPELCLATGWRRALGGEWRQVDTDACSKGMPSELRSLRQL